MFSLINEIAALQTSYDKLLKNQQLSKKAICDLVVPFRDKYGLADKEALMIARKEVSFADVASIFKGKQRVVPLTVDELRANDFPFWVNIKAHGFWSHYPAIKDTLPSGNVAVWCADPESYLSFDDYGSTWLAYLEEPKGDCHI